MKKNVLTNYLIIYDIRDGKRLAKVAKILLGFGLRVQQSVFEIACPPNLLDVIRKSIKAEIDVQEDYVVYFELCKKCWQKKMKFGNYVSIADDEEKKFLIL